MQIEVDIEGRSRSVIVRRTGDRFAVTVGGREHVVRASRVDAHTLALVIEAGDGDGPARSHEVVILPDLSQGSQGRQTVRLGAVTLGVHVSERARGRRRDEAAQTGSGPQRIFAPMPGKVVRVLARPGEAVAPRQAVVVIEAMKMENELRASGHGTVVDVHVREGQSVDAGALLAVIAPSESP